MANQAFELRYAQDHLAELAEQAAHGTEVILTRDGRPLAKIVPFVPMRRSREFGCAKGQLHIADDFDAPLEHFDEYT